MRKGIAFAALDLMGSLLLVIYALINPPVTEARSAIETHGRWAVVMTWEASDNDVDLWMQQPDGRRVFWRNPRSPESHLEQDDVGIRADCRTCVNVERMVIRSVQPGEAILTAHCYACYDVPIAVTVTLWRLQGADTKVYTVRLVMRRNREEQTAFRMRLSESGALQDLNRLPASLVHD